MFVEQQQQQQLRSEEKSELIPFSVHHTTLLWHLRGEEAHSTVQKSWVCYRLNYFICVTLVDFSLISVNLFFMNTVGVHLTQFGIETLSGGSRLERATPLQAHS